MFKPSVSEQQKAKHLKFVTGLSGSQGTKLGGKKGVFYRQDKALEALKGLIESGEHKPSEVTLFAQEVGRGGKRRFVVDTLAHFAMENAPNVWPKDQRPRGHWYEVILESRPCWLYFDLEFSKESNPKLKEKLVMLAFRKTLAAFCQDVLGMSLDQQKMLELESSTSTKFSRHVIVKALNTTAARVPLAFANNAQTGLLVNQLVKYAEAQRHASQSLSRYLFVQAPSQEEARREVCVIDESVYSRNRSFRLLFQSKFGKERRLDLDHSNDQEIFGGKPHPCIALVQTMASFVPEGTELFRHVVIPPDYGHIHAIGSRVRGGSVTIRRENGALYSAQCDPLLKHLVSAWDETRRLNEPKAGVPLRSWPDTVVQSCVELEGRILTVTLGNNHFCFCKGASHRSNHVYLVVDLLRGEFYQKCFDPDCRGYVSPSNRIPPSILESMLEEEDFINSLFGERFDAEEEDFINSLCGERFDAEEEDFINSLCGERFDAEEEDFINSLCGERFDAEAEDQPAKRLRIQEGGA